MSMTLLTTNDGSDVATSSFTTKIDSTYKLYIFKFYGVNPANDNVLFAVQFNAAGGSGYDETITSTTFRSGHAEGDGGTPFIAYQSSYDQAQTTNFQMIAHGVGNGADESCAGELFLFNPSSTSYIKHFHAQTVCNNYTETCMVNWVQGYANTTSAIDEVQFKMVDDSYDADGNMDAVIKMYGIK